MCFVRPRLDVVSLRQKGRLNWNKSAPVYSLFYFIIYVIYYYLRQSGFEMLQEILLALYKNVEPIKSSVR